MSAEVPLADPPNGWLLTPASNLVQFLTDEMIITGVTHRALISATAAPLLLGIARKQVLEANGSDEALKKLIEMSAGDQQFVLKQKADGYNTLFSHAAVAAWGAIEATIEHLLLNHIRRLPDADHLVRRNAPNLKDKSLRWVTDKDARSTLRAWESALPVATAVERAVHMLRAFNIAVELDSTVVKNLAELAELRNVILHRAGVIDQRFIDKCPWRKDKVGNKVVITFDTLEQYFNAAGTFAVKLLGGMVGSPHIHCARGVTFLWKSWVTFDLARCHSILRATPGMKDLLERPVL